MNEMPQNMPTGQEDVSKEQQIKQDLMLGAEKIEQLKEEEHRLKSERQILKHRLMEQVKSSVSLDSEGQEILNSLPIDEIQEISPDTATALRELKDWHSAKLREKKREEEEKEIENKNKELLQQASVLDIETEEGKATLNELIAQMSPEICSMIERSIDKRTRDENGFENNTKQKEILKNIHSFNIVSISTHEGGQSNWHLPSRVSEVNLGENENNDLTFHYDGETYKVYGVRGGYDRNVVVIIAMLEKITDFKGSLWDADRLELYTDLPFLKTFATPVEHQIFVAKESSEKMEDLRYPGKRLRRVDDQEDFSKKIFEKANRENPSLRRG